ncbi:MAG: hypothetical protein EBR73_11215 [Rhodobacteraceae bacterium]|jgi:hypothetical protein|nr:hypothetical protein [Paracoccaceae bacterium]
MKTPKIEITYIWHNDQKDFEFEFILNGEILNANVLISETEAYYEEMDEPGVYIRKFCNAFNIDDLTYFNNDNEPITLTDTQNDVTRHKIAEYIEEITNLLCAEYL